MSEYQYYEFQAIDRSLTKKEMDQLHSFSSEAKITATSFVDEYTYDDFGGNEDAWMDRYFDAFLYMANWGSRVLKLSLPAGDLPVADLRAYRAGDRVSAREKGGKVVLTLCSDDEEGPGYVEAEGILSSLVSLRAELARGDRRAVYLGWLGAVQEGEVSDEAKEPPVPAGLGELSAACEVLVDFLRLDSHLVEAAARASAPLVKPPDREEITAWLATIPAAEKDTLLAEVMSGEAPSVHAKLHQRLGKARGVGQTRAAEPVRRTVSELVKAGQVIAEEHERIAAQKAAANRQRKARDAAVARGKQLDALEGTEAALWIQVDDLVAASLPKGYDAAVKLLVDLRDLAARKGDGAFCVRLDALRAAYARKRTLLERMAKAGV
jgi:hypothetical protein